MSYDTITRPRSPSVGVRCYATVRSYCACRHLVVSQCSNDGRWVKWSERGIPYLVLCQHHYDLKVYRGEDVTGYERIDPVKW